MNQDLSSYWNNKFQEFNEKFIKPTDFGIKATQIMNAKGITSLLELGPGRGRDTFYFDQQNFNLTAVDISDAIVRYLSEKTKATVIQSDIKDISFADNSFEAVYARLSLHYFSDEDTDLIFEKIFNILIPGGLLFVQCKSTKDWEYGKGEKIGKDIFKHGHIRHFFSNEYLKEKANKFNIIELYEEKSDKNGEINNIISLVASKPE